MIVRGNKLLSQAYAVHMQGVYDHYSWRAFLANGGDPSDIFDNGLKAWKPGGSQSRDLALWLHQ